MTGRPTIYSEELALEICERVIMSPLHQVCKADDMPAESTVYNWLAKYDSFMDKYTRARKLRSFRRYESIDEIIAEMKAGDIDHNKARVMIDAIKWQTGKENPKIFGDKLELSGNNEAPLTVQVVRLGEEK